MCVVLIHPLWIQPPILPPHGTSFSQVIWSENFDASTSLPTGWAQYNVDGLTPNTSVSFMGTDAWVVRAKTTGGTDVLGKLNKPTSSMPLDFI